MPNLETAIRLIVIGQELLLALLLLLGSGNRNTRIAGALLVVGAAGYLYNSDAVLRDSLPALLPIVMLFAIAVPYFLWAFVRALFEAPIPGLLVTVPVLIVGCTTWLVFVGRDFFGETWIAAMDVLMHIALN